MTKTELLKISKPILFNTDMVRAIQENRKSVTRMVIKLKYGNTHFEMKVDKYGTRLIEIQNDVEGETFGKNADGSSWHKLRGYIEPKPKYKVGDILYVRETWFYESHMEEFHDISRYVYREASPNFPVDIGVGKHGWKPSIHMPKEAARIFLKVTGMRAERLQDITEEQAIKEGFNSENEFMEEFYKIYPKHHLDWLFGDEDMWAWVYEFERVECDEVN